MPEPNFNEISRIAFLLKKSKDNLLSGEEAIELENWNASNSHNPEPFKKLTDDNIIGDELLEMEKFPLQHHTQKILSKTVPVYHIKFIRIAAVAASVLLISFASWFFINEKNIDNNSSQLANQNKTIILPGSNKATLTLANGKIILLDSNNKVNETGNIKAINKDGKILFKVAGNNDETATAFNTVTTPKGGQYEVELSDGTQVWLNASSSITFPSAFHGKERNVSVTGEAYFEVAHNAQKPFSVKVRNMNVQVLGTHFNINAYDDESDIKTTLLQGSVKVNNQITLSPGQQSQVNGNGIIQVAKSINVESVMAWKNGRFVFNNSDVPTIMRALGKWYDVDIVYKNVTTDERFSANVSRQKTLNEVVKILKLSNINCSLEGRKLIVLP